MPIDLTGGRERFASYLSSLSPQSSKTERGRSTSEAEALKLKPEQPEVRGRGNSIRELFSRPRSKSTPELHVLDALKDPSSNKPVRKISLPTVVPLVSSAITGLIKTRGRSGTTVGKMEAEVKIRQMKVQVESLKNNADYQSGEKKYATLSDKNRALVDQRPEYQTWQNIKVQITSLEKKIGEPSPKMGGNKDTLSSEDTLIRSDLTPQTESQRRTSTAPLPSAVEAEIPSQSPTDERSRPRRLTPYPDQAPRGLSPSTVAGVEERKIPDTTEQTLTKMLKSIEEFCNNDSYDAGDFLFTQENELDKIKFKPGESNLKNQASKLIEAAYNYKIASEEEKGSLKQKINDGINDIKKLITPEASSSSTTAGEAEGPKLSDVSTLTTSAPAVESPSSSRAARSERLTKAQSDNEKLMKQIEQRRAHLAEVKQTKQELSNTFEKIEKLIDTCQPDIGKILPMAKKTALENNILELSKQAEKLDNIKSKSKDDNLNAVLSTLHVQLSLIADPKTNVAVKNGSIESIKEILKYIKIDKKIDKEIENAQIELKNRDIEVENLQKEMEIENTKIELENEYASLIVNILKVEENPGRSIEQNIKEAISHGLNLDNIVENCIKIDSEFNVGPLKEIIQSLTKTDE